MTIRYIYTTNINFGLEKNKIADAAAIGNKREIFTIDKIAPLGKRWILFARNIVDRFNGN